MAEPDDAQLREKLTDVSTRVRDALADARRTVVALYRSVPHWPEIAREVLRHGLPGFKDGIKLGRAYLKATTKSHYPVQPIDESKHVDLDAYENNKTYRNGARAGIETSVLGGELKEYVVKGYTYDTGPTRTEVEARRKAEDALTKKPRPLQNDTPKS